MLEDDLLRRLDEILRPLGARPEAGEEYTTPSLGVIRYYRRPVRLHWTPVLGTGLSVVALARQPVDLRFDRAGCRAALDRLLRAAHLRYPPWSGLALALTAVVLTPEPIRPDDDPLLQETLAKPPRGRAVPLALFRINLGQQAMACALRPGPAGLFPEPSTLADALNASFRRFLPPFPGASALP